MIDEAQPGTRSYRRAVDRLAGALVETYRACDEAGSNLPEALSYALGLAAKRLGFDPGPDAETAEGPAARWQAAGQRLVSQRPGCWEATHVAELVYDPGLIGEE